MKKIPMVLNNTVKFEVAFTCSVTKTILKVDIPSPCIYVHYFVNTQFSLWPKPGSTNKVILPVDSKKKLTDLFKMSV